MTMAVRFFPPDTDPYARAVEGLQASILRLRDSGWNEDLRQGTLGLAATLATVRRPGEPKKTRAVCRAIVSLLAVDGPEAAELRRSIAERLLELIERLRRRPSPRAS